MLCSISNGKSGSNWLDRLRSSKGFPADNNDLDLEHFLNPKSNPSISSEAKDFNAVLDKNHFRSNSELKGKTVDVRKKSMANSGVQKNDEEDWFNVMSSVLAELFNMGDSNEFQKSRGFDERKSSRKQSNPKICVLSASASAEDSCVDGLKKVEGTILAMSPSSADNSVTEVKGTCDRLKPKKQGNRASQTLEKISQMDFSASSRTEVTIIDTSSPTWKFEKLLFRMGKIWKVRDKKLKSRKVSACREKRKASQSDWEIGEKKKRKPSLSPSITTSKEVGREGRMISSNRGCLQNDRNEAKELPDNLSQLPKTRPPFSRSPRKPANRYTSVIHLHGIPTSSKHGVHPPKKCLKDT